MKSSRRGSAPALLLAVLAIAGLVALGDFGASPTIAVALLGTPPLFAAIFLSPAGTILVALLSVVAALVLTWLRSGEDYSEYVVPLVAVAVSSVVALVAAAVRGRQRAAEPTASSQGSESKVSEDIDTMTGLLNRRGAIRALGSRNLGDARVIAFIDCDAFHRVNEEHGRDVGDEFLQAVAGRLRHALPSRDTVARWGGDEFLAVLTAEPKAAVSALERVIGTINGHPIRTAAGPIETTMSVGAAPWAEGQELESAIAHAGRALRAAQESGGSQVALDAEPDDDVSPAEPSS